MAQETRIKNRVWQVLTHLKALAVGELTRGVLRPYKQNKRGGDMQAYCRYVSENGSTATGAVPTNCPDRVFKSVGLATVPLFEGLILTS